MKPETLISLCQPTRITGTVPEKIGKLVQDSRAVESGDVFIAVRGTQTDGHEFIDQAVDAGAAVVICEDDHRVPDTVCSLKVDRTRPLIGPLAQAFQGYPGRNLKLIGITGTNGKTTVATLTLQVLQHLGIRTSLLGTVAKQIGDRRIDSSLTTSDPIELAADMREMVKAGSTHLVMEVSSHALDQERTGGLDFDVAVFTNLTRDHLDYHSSISSYADAKKKLFDSLRPDAVAIVNTDDDHGEQMLEQCAAQAIRFGFFGRADTRAHLVESGDSGLVVELEGHRITSPLVGRFNAYNVSQAFLICRALGCTPEDITEALSHATGAAGRLERVAQEEMEDGPLVLVDYAHTPNALENVLSTLAGLKRADQSLHVIFGCGGNRDAGKRPRMAEVAEQFADRITVTSDNPRDEDPDAIIDDIMKGFSSSEKVIRITDREKAITDTILMADNNVLILIAGKGHETYQEIRGERYPFDDRKVARNALARRNGDHKPEEVT